MQEGLSCPPERVERKGLNLSERSPTFSLSLVILLLSEAGLGEKVSELVR